MLNEDAALKQVELTRQVEEINLRLRQISRELRELSKQTSMPQTFEDLLLENVRAWAECFEHTTGWFDITELYHHYKVWPSAMAEVGPRTFGKAVRKLGGVKNRKHPHTRRFQIWMP